MTGPGRRAAAVIALIAACVAARRGQGRPSPAPEFGVNATGRGAFLGPQRHLAVGQLLVDEFNARHKHLKVELSPVQDTQYVTKLATAIRSGSVPDVVGVDDINSQLFIYNQAFTDLTPLVNKLPYKDKLSPATSTSPPRTATTTALRTSPTCRVLWYNKTLFKKAGLDPDKPPRNFAEILTDARAITKLGHGVNGFSFAGRCEGVWASP